MADGVFHNSQIKNVDPASKTLTYQYKAWVDKPTRKKRIAETKMDIYEFMAKILFHSGSP